MRMRGVSCVIAAAPARWRVRPRRACTVVQPCAADTVLLHAAGSLRGALTEVSKAFEASSGDTVQAKYGPSGLLKDEIAGGAQGRGVRLRQHGASAGAGRRQEERPGRAVRAQPAVRAGAARARGRRREPARAHARPRGQARHLDAEGRPVGRLCLRGVPQGRHGEARRARRAGEEGAAAHRRADERAAAGGPQRLWLARRRGPRRHLPHLLHQRARRRSRKIPASRSWRCRMRSRSAPTTG